MTSSWVKVFCPASKVLAETTMDCRISRRRSRKGDRAP